MQKEWNTPDFKGDQLQWYPVLLTGPRWRNPGTVLVKNLEKLPPMHEGKKAGFQTVDKIWSQFCKSNEHVGKVHPSAVWTDPQCPEWWLWSTHWGIPLPSYFWCETTFENQPLGFYNQDTKLFPSWGERDMKRDSISVTIISTWIPTQNKAQREISWNVSSNYPSGVWLWVIFLPLHCSICQIFPHPACIIL